MGALPEGHALTPVANDACTDVSNTPNQVIAKTAAHTRATKAATTVTHHNGKANDDEDQKTKIMNTVGMR